MSRTDLDATTLANSLRMKAGDGSIEWVSEPIQASVLLDIADMMAENAKLKQELEAVGTAAYLYGRNDLAKEGIMSDSTPTTQGIRDYIDDTQKDLIDALRKLADVCNAEELHVLNKALERCVERLRLAEADE